MPKFTREILVRAAPIDVWKVVSDIDSEPDYWHGTREVVNLRREGNVTDRVVVQNFMGTRVEQRVTLNPPDSVDTEYLKGTTVGRKTVSILPEGRSQCLVRADWDVRFSGLLLLMTPVISNHIVKGTESALVRIRDVSEGRGPVPSGTPEGA